MDEDAEHEPVRLLLEQRANPDLAPAGVQAPLLLSCAKGFPEVVAWLLAAGADLDVRDDNGCTALHLSCLRAEPTIAAACTRQLLAAGAEADGLTASGMTPLMMACHRGNAYCVEQMLRARADCTASTPDGVMTPLP
mmetsp:Transcript_10046/g.23997  ORF Transcript_10046/g.23997 Transcript_10046/m.23997 type:complete len:137 (-) Transcript_10046:10-420(-)